MSHYFAFLAVFSGRSPSDLDLLATALWFPFLPRRAIAR
jgi:hypothetical protein